MLYVVCWPDGSVFSVPLPKEQAEILRSNAALMWRGEFTIKEA